MPQNFPNVTFNFIIGVWFSPMVLAMVLAERWGMVSHDGILDLDSIDGIAVIVGRAFC